MDIIHITVHKSAERHGAFPSVIKLSNGNLVVVFREAPIREERVHTHWHVGPESSMALVRSEDGGRTWDSSSKIVIDASSGTHDVNLAAITELSGELVINYHRFLIIPTSEESRMKELEPERSVGSHRSTGWPVFDGVYFTYSSDNGWTWSESRKVDIPPFKYRLQSGRNGMIQISDGLLLSPFDGRGPKDRSTRVFVVRSKNGGKTWGDPSTVAHDPEGRIGFYEPSLLRLPDGKIIAMLRTEGDDHYLYQAFSTDEGRTWEGLRRTEIWGYPAHLIRLRSGRILCAYGYRREPFGIRAVLSEDDGETWDIEHEKVLRKDGLHEDLGYPASVQLDDDRILTVYYFHGDDGIRFIGGSIYMEE